MSNFERKDHSFATPGYQGGFLRRYPTLVLVLFASLLYSNTLKNDFAVDDTIVLTRNTYVQKGLSGIPDLLTREYFSGCADVDNSVVSGGRYRPMTLIFFAIQYQLFGINAAASHLMNVVLYALLLFLLYRLAERHLFKGYPWYVALVSCLLFAVHPVHAETVANVKGSDELLAFIFGISALLSFLKYRKGEKRTDLAISLFMFLMALLCKESSVSLLAVMALLLYFPEKESLKRSVLAVWPFLPVLLGYLVLRFSVVGFHTTSSRLVLASPFYYATPVQAFATKMWVQLKCILLFFFPSPLSSDYSFDSIPYVGLFSIEFLLAAIVLLFMLVVAVKGFGKRSAFSFAVLYYGATVVLVSNFFIPVGTPMAERLLFQPSLAFCMIIALLFTEAYNRYRSASVSLLVLVMVLFSAKTYSRNEDWKDNATLNLRDLRFAPRNMKLNQFAAEHYYALADSAVDSAVRVQYIDSALRYAHQAAAIDSLSPVPWVELGAISYIAARYDSTAFFWLTAYRLMPAYPDLQGWMKMLADRYFRSGNELYENKQLEPAIANYQMAVKLDPKFVGSWYQLGNCYDQIQDSVMAELAWQKVQLLDPHLLRRNSSE